MLIFMMRPTHTMDGDMRLSAASFVLTKALSAGSDLVIDSAVNFS